MAKQDGHHPPAPSSKEEGEPEAPSSLEEGVGGGGPTRQTLLNRAAEMRRNPTETERRMWMQLRARRFVQHKFRRQAVIEPWIVDFLCPAKGLVIEIDGDTHDPERDRMRDALIKRKTGFRILRFTNIDVMRNMDGVLIALQMALEASSDRWRSGGRHHPPAPSSKEEGEPEAPSSLEEGVGGGGGLHHA